MAARYCVSHLLDAVPAEGAKIWVGQQLKTLVALSFWSTPTVLNLGKLGAGGIAPVPTALSLQIVSWFTRVYFTLAQPERKHFKCILQYMKYIQDEIPVRKNVNISNFCMDEISPHLEIQIRDLNPDISKYTRRRTKNGFCRIFVC